ncbi:hypothetical protein RRG08_034238 [Elysia crispata]|uniref:Uncharacterized protein n=1 Tax=Elysia crispata TaxID=231223 RepID=A0AAE1A297_9GAST|nr:hypothetical protein RRG08_034238 [Elysia crispata]
MSKDQPGGRDGRDKISTHCVYFMRAVSEDSRPPPVSGKYLLLQLVASDQWPWLSASSGLYSVHYLDLHLPDWAEADCAVAWSMASQWGGHRADEVALTLPSTL